MKTYNPLTRPALVTLFILMLPLSATLFTDEMG